MRIRSITKHALQAIAEGSLIALLIVGLMAGTAFAGKPGGSSLSVVTVTDQNANGVPNWADQVHFTINTSNAYPVVSLTCYKGETLVYADSRPYYWPNIWDDPGIFTLSSQAWSSGAADCRADLKGTSRGRTVTLGSTSFYVGA